MRDFESRYFADYLPARRFERRESSVTIECLVHEQAVRKGGIEKWRNQKWIGEVGLSGDRSWTVKIRNQIYDAGALGMPSDSFGNEVDVDHTDPCSCRASSCRIDNLSSRRFRASECNMVLSYYQN